MDELSQRLADLSPAKRAILQLRLEQRNRARAGTLAIPPRLDRTSAPASFAQERLWFLSQLEPTHSVYNISRVVHLAGPLSVLALELALREIVSRHEALRTSFVWTGESLRQLIDENLSIPLTQIDLSDLDENQRSERAKLLTKQDLEQPFDLSTGPIIRTTLLRLTDDEHILSLVTHHIVSDAWSATILFNELEQLYEAFADEKPSPLRPLSVQYPDFAEWQRERLQGSTLASLLSYWNEKLTGAPLALDVPTDHPRPPAQTFRGSHRSLSLSRDLTDQLNSLSRHEGATLFMTLLAAFQVLLCRYSRQYDIVVGSPISGRNMSEIEDLLGVFINTLVLRADLTGNPTFKELLAQVRDTALEAYEHQDLPFEKLVEELQPQRDLGRSPIVQVMFQLQNAPRSARTLKGLKVRTIQVERESAKFDLFLTAREVDGALNLSMEYSTDLFDGATIDRMLGHYENLLKSFVVDPEIRVLNAPLVTHLEERQILTDWNDTFVEFPNLCIHQIFEERASRNPDEVAVVCEEAQLTNRELNARANQLAHHLLKLGVKRETRVGIYLNRSLEMVISLLGVLKAGAAYVPLDPVFPGDRLAFMIEDADLSVLLTQKSLHADLPSHHTTVVELDTEWDSICQNSQKNPVTKSTTDNLAYVIYTSGSTGTPKGVEIGHRALTNFLFSVQKQPGLVPDDVLVAVTTLSFDIAGLEIYLPLMTGARLVTVNREVAADGIQLKQKIADCGATVMQATPATWQMLIDAGWEGQKGLKVLCGGEALSRELANELMARGMTVWNMYGPTETTIWSTTCKLGDGNGPISIGRPIANTQIYLLDEKQQPVPIGIAGELHIGGDGLARGYLKRPELTAEKFIPNQFSDERNARLYKTGDLARYLANGDIEYLGRLDNQVKIRGYRIELGEIDSVLRQHESVGDAVVTAHEDESGDRRLVAYVIADRKERDTAPEDYWPELVSDLRRHLRQQLPEYMVPAMYVELSQLPLTANGKVDRRALPSPDTARPEQEEEFVAPRTATEEKLASIWTEVLKIDRVGINDNFFHLGGHSLLATQVIGRIRNSLQIELPLRAFFEAPTITGLVEKLHTGTASENGLMSPITPVSRNMPLPLSFAQQRLWFLNELEGDSAFYNVPWALRLHGELNVRALRQALETIVKRHETLRTTFTMVGEKPYQVISDSAHLPFSITDLSELTQRLREIEVKRLGTNEARQPFDLKNGPVIRGLLLRLRPDDHMLVVNSHHIVSDGWSIQIFLRELTDLYESFVSGRPHSLPALNLQYADYAVWEHQWLQGDLLQKQIKYWKQQLRGSPALLDLPKDRPRPAVQTFNGATKSQQLKPELTKALNDFSRQEGVTLFMTLLATFQLLLSRYTAQKDIVVGSPIAGRNQQEIEPLIGFFVNTLMLRTDLSGNPSFRQLLGRVKEMALAAYANQELPFEKLVDELQPERSLSHAPLFQVMFALQNAPRTEFTLSGLSINRLRVATKTSKFDVTLFATEIAENLNLAIEYNTDLFDEERIERMLGHLGTLLEAVVQKPEARIGEFEILTEPERERLLVDWNQTADEFRVECIHDLFEEQVERTPEEVAVVFETGQVTYRELNARANQFAWYLKKRGVGPEVLVGVCVERSLEMVVGLLGILKAGGAYVPLDPAYPAERLRFMLEDANARLLVTQQQLLNLIPESSADIVCLDSDWPEISKESEANPPTIAAAENLAYVIYTSASTGKSKGVEIGHRALTNFLFSVQKQPGLVPDDVLVAVTTLSFDIAGLEIYLPLMTGARLVIVNREVAADGIQLKQKIADCGATVMQATPATWQMLIDAGWEGQKGLKVLCGGEALSRELANELLAHGMTVWNMYGPTETTIWSTTCKLSAGSGPISIGRPIANTQIYLLDEKQQPVPIGIAGELHIGGDGLARGYLKRPELTAEKFIPNQFSDERNARLYKTGDLARYLANGDIEYLGRLDNQVKIRGYRIELGEIESVLRQHESVGDAVVTAHEDESGDRRLVAYVIADRKERDTAPEDYWSELVSDLRRHLRQQLPEYMVPAMYVELSQLPLTANGKVDRRALPRPDTARPEQEEEFVAPRTATEEKVASIWTEVLKLDRVGINDNFFHLGGHSLLATQVIGRIRNSLQIELPLRAFFEAPTITGLSEKLDSIEPITKPVAVPALKSRRRSALSIEQLSPEEVDSLLLKVLSETDR